MTKAAGYVAAALAVALGAGCGGRERASGGKGPKFRTAPITRTDVVSTVEATGKVTPRNSETGIPVGAQVNGKLIKLFVDYNSVVTNGQVVALIDPLVYSATYKGALAQLHVNEANVEVRRATVRSAESKLVLAEKTLERKRVLFEKRTCSEADLDSAVQARDAALADVDSAKANLRSAEAAVEQSVASVAKSEADLKYCTIVSPVDGVVIDRKVEEGETVVSSMNAVPVLTIAEDLRTVWIKATIPEADIGSVSVGQEVTFTADAYRHKFKGRVKQIRKAATETNNVVTFPVIIEAENTNEQLFPGMTATLAIETARAQDVPVVSAAAFRFRPKPEDMGAAEDVPKGPKLWFAKPDGTLEVVAVRQGVSDTSFTQVTAVDGTSLEGRQAVVGYATASLTRAAAKGQENPFMPKMPSRGKNKGTAPGGHPGPR